MATTVWTERAIRSLIEENDVAVERAMVNMTERALSDRMGRFTSPWSNRGIGIGRFVMEGNRLEGKLLSEARTIALWHLEILTWIANRCQPWNSKKA